MKFCLFVCFQEGHTSTIKELLELGADLHARDRKGRSGKSAEQTAKDTAVFQRHTLEHIMFIH